MLNRQVILGEAAWYSIPELEFEVPEKGACATHVHLMHSSSLCAGEAGLFTTIEGLLTQAVEGLSAQQPQRKVLFLYSRIIIWLMTLVLKDCGP